MNETVGSLAALVHGEVRGEPTTPITGVGDLRFAGPACIGFLRSNKLADAARTTRLGALLVPEFVDTPAAQILVEDVDLAFARVVGRFHPPPQVSAHEVHPQASVHPDAVLGTPVRVEAMAVIGKGARIGAGSVVGAGTVVGENCVVGRDCVLHPRVVLYPGITLGDRVHVHSGAVIGADGFGYVREKAGPWVKWPQIGTVTVGDDVEIGANSTIDRGALGVTKIGRGSKLDNLVHIGHNCTLGEHVAIAALSALAGSAHLGDRVQMGGHVITSGHLRLGDDVRVGGNSAVYDDIDVPGDYYGFPTMPRDKWFRTLRELDRLADSVKSLRDMRRRLRELERRSGGAPPAPA